MLRIKSARALVAACVLFGSVLVVAQAATVDAVAPRPTRSTLATGRSHTLVVREDGTLLGFGRNYYGQLGILTNYTSEIATNPTLVLTDVVAVAAGDKHSLALKSDGTLWTFGSNEFGQLGHTGGLGSSNSTPTQVMTDVVAIAANGDHSLAVKSDGTLWTFGRNDFGQLGNGTSNNTTNPTPTQVLTNVAAVGAGRFHSFAVKTDGTLWTFGKNDFGQLGFTQNALANPTPTQVAGLTDIVAAVGGTSNSVALQADGTVLTFGLASYGQLGNAGSTDGSPHPTPALAAITGVTSIAAREDHVLAIKADGSLWVWGYNFFGQFLNTDDVGLVAAHSTPAEADVGGVTEISTGNAFSIALTTGGTVYSAGVNDYGQLGNLTTSTDPDGTPEQVLFDVLQPDTYVSMVPARLMDSRPTGVTVDGLYDAEGIRTAGSTTELDVTDRAGVPNDAVAVSLNVTVSGPTANGFVSVFPCGTTPQVSNLNFIAGKAVPNSVIVKVGDDGEVCLSTWAATHLIVDVNGFYPATTTYVPGNGDRIWDSRPGSATGPAGIRAAGSTTALYVGTQRTAVVVNVTAVAPQSNGYVTVYPCDAMRPNASNLNYVAGRVVPNLVISKVADDGTICFYTSASTHLLADIGGYYPTSSTFAPLTPDRWMDTRVPASATVDGSFQGIGPRAPGSTTALQITGRGAVPANATVVTLNVTVTGATTGGYLTVYPCGSPVPNASNLNFSAGQTIANLVISQIGAGGAVCVFTSGATDVIVDVNGYYGLKPWAP